MPRDEFEVYYNAHKVEILELLKVIEEEYQKKNDD
jgi:hypothetical protein